MRISDLSSDVCSSDLCCRFLAHGLKEPEDVPPNVAALLASACGFGSWDETLAAYDEARQCVTEHWSLIATGIAACLRRDRRRRISQGRAKRSEERRVGKQWVSTCGSRECPIH